MADNKRGNWQICSRICVARRGAAMALLADGRAWPDGGAKPPFQPVCAGEIPYAIERYVKETNRLYGVLNKRLADRPFVAGDYSIADMAAYPWIVPHKRQGQNLDDFPHLNRWFEEIKARPATVRAYERANEINTEPTMTEEAKKGSLRADAAVVKSLQATASASRRQGSQDRGKPDRPSRRPDRG